MTRPTAQRPVLVPQARLGERDARERRYRLARLRIDALRRATDGPFGHLKRVYD